MSVSFCRVVCSVRPVAFIVLGWLSLTAHADESQKPWESEPPPLIVEDRVRLQVSIWNTSIDTIVRADSSPTAQNNTITTGTTFNGERDLGLKKKKVTPDFELTFFPGDHHILRLSGFSSERTGEVTLTAPVQFHNDTYKAGDRVKSEVDINLVGLTYGYRIFKAPRYELAATLRIQAGTFSTNLQGPANYTRQPDTITLPLPMAGGEGRVQIYKKLNFTARYQWLGATVVDTKGVIREWQAGLMYQFFQNFGVELAYRGYSIHVDSNSTDHPGTLDMRYSGLQLGFRASL